MYSGINECVNITKKYYTNVAYLFLVQLFTTSSIFLLNSAGISSVVHRNNIFKSWALKHRIRLNGKKPRFTKLNKFVNLTQDIDLLTRDIIMTGIIRIEVLYLACMNECQKH